MYFLAASAFLKALGWALVNSVWQFAICWLLYRTVTAAGKNITATIKHSIALSLLALGTVFFIAELSWKFYDVTSIAGVAITNLVVENSSLYNSWQTAGDFLDTFMPYWSLLYLACIVLLFIKLCFFVRRAGSLQHNGTTKISADWRIYLKNISAQLGIQKEVGAFLSIHIDTPQVIGFLKPVILIPAACLVNLTTKQLEAVLLHELVHIKRNDYLVNMFVASIEILFFFNPFVKQITNNIRKEREYSCDDMVVQFQYHPGDYASALLTLEKNRLIPVTYGIAAIGKNQKQLLTRIERIVGIKNKQSNSYQIFAGLAALMLLGFIATIHPSKTSFDEFAPGIIGLADNNLTGRQFSNETTTTIKNKNVSVGNADKQTSAVKNKIDRPSAVKNNDAANADPDLFTEAAFADNDNNADDHVINAATKEARDFSLPQKQIADLPESPDASSNAPEPYVPSNSFSYQVIQDTSIPKIKGETYAERKAREAQIKAQKAMAEINWQKIEKDFKYNKLGLAKLKKELTVQLQNLNWQKINADVQNQLNGEQIEALQETIKQNQVIKEYQQTEAYYEALHKNLAEQAQVIKISHQRAVENQKTVEEQQKKLQAEMRKKRIIYL
ncbi:MAG: M56 family metallopeptidase [Bacteroidota bacterium]